MDPESSRTNFSFLLLFFQGSSLSLSPFRISPAYIYILSFCISTSVCTSSCGFYWSWTWFYLCFNLLNCCGFVSAQFLQLCPPISSSFLHLIKLARISQLSICRIGTAIMAFVQNIVMCLVIQIIVEDNSIAGDICPTYIYKIHVLNTIFGYDLCTSLLLKQVNIKLVVLFPF